MEKFPTENLDELPQPAENIEQEPSFELRKFKAELASLEEPLDGLAFNLKKRADEDLVDFIDYGDLGMLRSKIAELKEVDVYTDTNLEKTRELFLGIRVYIETIEMIQPKGPVKEDVDSLVSLMGTLKALSDMSLYVEAAAQQLSGDNGQRIRNEARLIGEIALEKAQYVAGKVDALEGR